MSDTTAPQPDPQTSPSGTKSPSTLVFCELPDNGGTIITTLQHCNILNGTDIGKVPPATTRLVACSYDGHTIHTRESDCTMLGGTAQGEVARPGDPA